MLPADVVGVTRMCGRRTSRLRVERCDGGLGFTFNRVSQSLPPAIDWSGFEWLIGDVNGDGLDDVLWIGSETMSGVYVGVSVGR